MIGKIVSYNDSVKDIQPDWENAPSRDDLYNDYAEAEPSQEAYRDKLKEYAETLNGGPDIKPNKKGKSTVKSYLTREHAEWKKSSLSEAIHGTRDLIKVDPIGGEDVESAIQSGLLLNNQFNTKINKVKLVDDIVKTIVEEGTVIIKTGWEAELGVKMVEKEQPTYASPEELMAMVEGGQLPPEEAQAIIDSGQPMQTGTEIVYVEEETLVKNQMSLEVCLNANVMVDPTCEGVIENANFVIHEFETSYAELKLEEYYKDEETGEESGYYYNIDLLEFLGDDKDVDDAKSDASNQFYFKDKARKKIRAYEYWGYWDIQGDGVLVAIIATWVGKTLIRLQENPFPHQRIPFSMATYMPVKNTPHGEPDQALTKDYQDLTGRMLRAMNDKIAEDAVGQKFINSTVMGPIQKNQYEKGNDVWITNPSVPMDKIIWKNDISQVNDTPFNVIGFAADGASKLSGARAYATGQGGGKSEPNSQQKDAMDAVAKRESAIQRRISAMLVDSTRMTLANCQVFMSEEEVVRTTGNQFITIHKDDVQGYFDISVSISTPEKDEDQATKIMTLMQTNGPSEDPEIKKINQIKMYELWGLPDVADAIRNMPPPQPDPIAQEMQALALEEQKLKNALLMKEMEKIDASIYEKMSRTEENIGADIELKLAKAEQANAAAEKNKAETDVIDQTFLNVESGQAREEKLEDKELDALHKETADINKSNSDIEKTILLNL